MNVVINLHDAIDYLHYMEREVIELERTYRDYTNSLIEKRKYEAGDRWASDSNWTCEEYKYYIQQTKIKQYEIYLKLMNVYDNIAKQDKDYRYYTPDCKKHLININPLYLQSIREAVIEALELENSNKVECPY